MYRFFLLFFTAIISLHADRAVHFDAGWQLAGLTQATSDMHLFDDHAVIVWAYDADTQSWRGYSPNTDTMQKIVNSGVGPLEHLDAFQAFWINSSAPWDAGITSSGVPMTTDTAVTLDLKAGWNLVALPSRTVLDTEVFGDATVWKYSGDWAVKSDTDLPFPTADTVATSEGFWVRSDSDRTIDIPFEASALRTFDDKAAMLDYLKAMMTQQRYPSYGFLESETDFSGSSSSAASSSSMPPQNSGDDTDFSGSEGDGGASDATSTNLQEAGVDESDILKHDGTTLFFADRGTQQIRMTTFDALASGDDTALPVINFEGSLHAMYLQNNRLILVTGAAQYYTDFSTDALIAPPGYDVPHLSVSWYDVSDTSNIVKTASQTIDGHYSESRMNDGKLYLITQFSPVVTYDYAKVYTEDARCSELYQLIQDQEKILESDTGSASSSSGSGTDTPPIDPPVYDEYFKSYYEEYYDLACYRYNYDENGSAWYYDYADPIINYRQLIPTITDGTATEDYVIPQRFYAPYKIDQTAQITTVGAFDAVRGDLFSSTSYTGYAELTYASAHALYLVSKQYPYYYDYDYYKERSAVYKFALDENLSYRGRGFVDGRMLSQYSLSEYDDILRVATTSGWSWGAGDTDNAVFTLEENGNETLGVVGELRGLGKPGETIHAVRFIGDKGFVVTFRQTDPFYTIDLSNPAAPKKVGELEINGFSEYLHPIDSNRLLSVGRDADADGRTTGLLLQLYDISDFADPKLADTLKIGDRYTYSEVEYNPRALAYRASDGLFGLPVYGDYNGYDVGFNLYRVNGLTLEPLNEIAGNIDRLWITLEGRGVIYNYGSLTYGTLFKGEHTLTETINTGADE